MTFGDMPVTRSCEDDGCDERSIVGWGNPPVWLCQAHFEERLARIAEMLLGLRAGDG